VQTNPQAGAACDKKNGNRPQKKRNHQ